MDDNRTTMKNSDLLHAVVQNAIDGIISIDEMGIIESINPSACKLFGYLPEEALGRNVSMLMPPPDSLQHDHYLQRYKTTHQRRIIGIGREVNGLRRDGSKFPLLLGVSEVVTSEKTFYVGFIHDLTHQKQVEERLKDYAVHLEELVEIRTESLNHTITELEQAKEQISESLENEKELNKLKSRFLSMASHEFRTPLSTVQLSASLIEKYAEPFGIHEIGKHVGKIKSAVAGLTIILNDFLQLERLESGKVQAAFTTFDLSELASEITEEMQFLIKDGQKINFRHTGEKMVSLDKNLLKNSIVNLITNAVKYSGENASIDFRTEIAPDVCRITVKDNGIGIPDDDQKYLFEPFFRAHNTGSIPGTGLGLNIVARHVSLMNGRIDFESKNAEGTLFTLSFPL